MDSQNKSINNVQVVYRFTMYLIVYEYNDAQMIVGGVGYVEFVSFLDADELTFVHKDRI